MATPVHWATLVIAISLCAWTTLSRAQDLPAEIRAKLPALSLIGQADMRFLGFDVYRASFWAPSGFGESTYERSSFVLELSYLRSFKGADIAKRSVAEMVRQGDLPGDQLANWEAQMRRIFPDVKPGDRIAGVNLSGEGATFLANGRWIGEVRDPEFAKRFFGIWLSVQTSEPKMRQLLLSQPKTNSDTGVNRP